MIDRRRAILAALILAVVAFLWGAGLANEEPQGQRASARDIGFALSIIGLAAAGAFLAVELIRLRARVEAAGRVIGMTTNVATAALRRLEELQQRLDQTRTGLQPHQRN